MRIWGTSVKVHLGEVESHPPGGARPSLPVLWLPFVFPRSACQTPLRLLEASLVGTAPQAAAPIEFSERKGE